MAPSRDDLVKAVAEVVDQWYESNNDEQGVAAAADKDEGGGFTGSSEGAPFTGIASGPDGPVSSHLNPPSPDLPLQHDPMGDALISGLITGPLSFIKHGARGIAVDVATAAAHAAIDAYVKAVTQDPHH